MRPKKLTLCGWGPYKEETNIDFEGFSKRNLFLITGQTGAGKTTVFDAITYALYGTLSGEVREKASVRSDFADEDTPTYVRLILTHWDNEYEIRRNPEYMRKSKRKNGELTKEKESASLVMPDGTIIAGNQEVTTKVQEILGMDVRQFRQISMIPQGDFARMLLASSAEKTTIFREIFKTGIYASMQNVLKDKASKLYREYMEYYHRMEEDVRILNPQDEEWRLLTEKNINFDRVMTYLSDKIEKDSRELGELELSEEKLETAIQELLQKESLIKETNQRFDELEKAEKEKEELCAQKDVIFHKKAVLEKCRKAGVLSSEQQILEGRIKELENKREKVRDNKRQAKELQTYLKENEEILHMQQEIEDAYQIKALLEATANNCQTMQKERVTAEKNYTRLQQIFETAQDKMEKKQTEYNHADNVYRKSIVGVVAKMIVEGEPCPVCGSTTHPHVATLSEEAIDEATLDKMKEAYEQSRQERDNCYDKAVAGKQDLQQKKELLKHEEEELERLGKKREELSTAVLAVTDKIPSLDAYTKFLLQIREKQVRLDECLNRQKDLEKEEKTLVSEIELQDSALDEKISRAGFAGREEFREYIKTDSEINAMEQEVSLYNEKVASTERLITHLQEMLAGKMREESAPLQKELAEKQAEKHEIKLQIQNCRIKLEQMKQSLSGIKVNSKIATKKKEEYGYWKDLDELANGNNAKRLVFEQYVLAGYFEQILKCANLRLKAMTDGRYELRRVVEVKDGRKKDNLEMSVMDYYTGKERSVKTLSGGETFKASLSLALGMSDCIRAENGGIRVETLFIDEGFGALDEESLDQACHTLQSLAQNNRLIGIISHVQELRERIEQQIVVEKKQEGSYIYTIY